jgi:transcriptional regulator with XRE-family HTH domain
VITDTGALIDRARVAAGLSQRALADAASISQSTLMRILSGDRAAKMPELVAIAWATGHTVAQLTKHGTATNRVQCGARVTNNSGMDRMHEALLYFLELDDYLNDQAIPATVCRRVEDCALDGTTGTDAVERRGWPPSNRGAAQPPRPRYRSC